MAKLAHETVELSSDSESSDGIEIIEDESELGSEVDSDARDANRPPSPELDEEYWASTKDSSAKINPSTVGPDIPLPRPPSFFSDFDCNSFAPARHPPLATETAEDGHTEEATRIGRMQEDRKMDGAEWEWYWSLESSAARRPKGKRRPPIHCASFFPYWQYEGLEYLDGVFATVKGSSVDLYRLADAAVTHEVGDFEDRVDCSRGHRELVASTKNTTNKAQDQVREEYFTCAWSVKVDTWPYTPVLAVGGRGRVIQIFVVSRDATTSTINMTLERTLTGHGMSIFDLKFSRSHPHLLISASEDHHVRLWDPTVPHGSNAVLERRVQTHLASLNSKRTPHNREESGKQASFEVNLTAMARPFVDGEVRGILAKGGHTRGVLCADIHPTLPLIVTSGMDGRINVWSIPASLRGPSWPTKHLYEHPAPLTVRPPPPPSLGPPIFSSPSIHPGQWPDQVIWASASSSHILSKAPHRGASADANAQPGKEVKLWIPTILDTAPNRQRDEHLKTPPTGPATNCNTRQYHPHLPNSTHLLPQPDHDNSISHLFRVEKRLGFDDTNYIGDTMALHRAPVFSSPSSTVMNTFLAIPTMTPPSLYTFRLFSALTPSPAPSPSSLSTKTQELSLLSHLTHPPTRLRPSEDFVPRWRPSGVGELGMGKGLMHVRSVAVQPEGGRWMVGVGDDGLITWWRRRRRGVGVKREDEGEGGNEKEN